MLGGFPQLDSEHLPDAEPLLRPVFPTVQSVRHGSRTGRAMGHSLSFFERADALRLVAEDIDGRWARHPGARPLRPLYYATKKYFLWWHTTLVIIFNMGALYRRVLHRPRELGIWLLASNAPLDCGIHLNLLLIEEADKTRRSIPKEKVYPILGSYIPIRIIHSICLTRFRNIEMGRGEIMKHHSSHPLLFLGKCLHL